MTVLIIGRGSREHALASMFCQYLPETTIFVAPGNPGISEPIVRVPIDELNISELLRFCFANSVQRIVVVDEVTIIAGITDILRDAGFKVFGASQRNSLIETSRCYAKSVLTKSGLSVASWRAVTDLDELELAIRSIDPPWVIKSTGPSSGLPVIITSCGAAAMSVARRDLRPGKNPILVESFIHGSEHTLTCVVVDGKIRAVWQSYDYKRLLDGDQGPLTGGMGSVVFGADLDSRLISQMSNLVDAIAFADGILAANIILTRTNEPIIAEVNVHLSTPEAEAIASTQYSLLPEAILSPGKLRTIDAVGCSLVLSSRTYPYGNAEVQLTGEDLIGIDFTNRLFHRWDGDDYRLFGKGRIGTLVDSGRDIASCRRNLLTRARRFDNFYYRTDIGADPPRTYVG